MCWTEKVQESEKSHDTDGDNNSSRIIRCFGEAENTY